MKVEFELTDKDKDEIAEKVIQKLSDKAFMESVHKTSEEVARKQFWPSFEKLHSEIELHDFLDKKLMHLIKDALNERNLIENELSKILNSKDLKKVTADSLRAKAYQLELEAEELD